MSYTAERRIEEKEQRRTEIIDAAEVVFAGEGLEAATLGQVARQARLSRGLIYFYFKDKEDLICAVAQRSLRLLHERFEAVAEQHPTGIEKVGAMGRAYFEFARTHPLYARLITHWGFHETPLDGMSENQAACMVEGNRVFDVLTRAIRAGMADGTIDPELGDPMNTAVALWSFTHGLFQISAQKGPMLQRFHGLNTRDLVDHAFRLLQQSLRPPT